jgi:hypothetical protein
MARKTNSESKPAVSAGIPSTSSTKKTKRTVVRGGARHKASSVDPAETASPSPDPAPTTPESPNSTLSISSLSTAVGPDRDEIARLAYSYWEQRGFSAGSPEEDWLRAERELSQRAMVAAI